MPLLSLEDRRLWGCPGCHATVEFTEIIMTADKADGTPAGWYIELHKPTACPHCGARLVRAGIISISGHSPKDEPFPIVHLGLDTDLEKLKAGAPDELLERKRRSEEHLRGLNGSRIKEDRKPEDGQV